MILTFRLKQWIIIFHNSEYFLCTFVLMWQPSAAELAEMEHPRCPHLHGWHLMLYYRLRHLSSPLYDLSFFRKTDRLPCIAISGQHHKNMNVEAVKPVKASFWKPHGIISTAFSFQSKTWDHSDSRWGSRLHLSVPRKMVQNSIIFYPIAIHQRHYNTKTKSKFSEIRILGFQSQPLPALSALLLLTSVGYMSILWYLTYRECLREIPGILKSTQWLFASIFIY